VSTFSALNAATTALWAQRRGLDITGQNIANVNTEGYSRQRADLQAIGGSVVPAFHSTSPGIGAGVNVDSVQRIRDAFLEGRGHTERANSAQLVAEADAFTQVESSFREPGDTGIQSLMGEMWAAWGDVDNGPHQLASRGQVLETLKTLVGGLQFSHASMGTQWEQTRDNLGVLVADVNKAAESVAQLNQAIQRATQADLPANDLKDQRDVLVMKLAEQVGATARPGEDGMVDVVVGGMSLVSKNTASALAVAGATTPDGATADRPRLETAAGGFTVRAGGTAAGQLSALTTIIPGYRQKLDEFARDLATALNDAHTDSPTNPAYDLNGDPGAAILGPPPPGTITASSIEVLITDPEKIAASKLPRDANGLPALDSSNADAIEQLRLPTDGPDAKYRAMIVELGVQAAVTSRNLGIQQVITTQVDAARESVAGVNLDEEMTNMLTFQHAYSAAGRLVTAIDQTLDTLINRTGLVGR
jgi:flagellar hook-associated protein 1 FlgK